MNMQMSLNTLQKDVDEAQLEELTRKYLLGEINLDSYKEAMEQLGVKLDLRKMASKIKTGRLKGELPR